MADAYKVIKDVSLPKPTEPGDTPVVSGATYAEGDYVFPEELTPRDRERAENGELDEFLESVSGKEAEEARESSFFGRQFHARTAEHEAEAVVMEQYGHEVVPRSELIEEMSAGAEPAREALEAAKDGGADERPGLTSPETPDLAKASAEGTTITPDPDTERKASPRRAPKKKTPSTQTRPAGQVAGKAKEAGEGE